MIKKKFNTLVELATSLGVETAYSYDTDSLVVGVRITGHAAEDNLAMCEAFIKETAKKLKS